MQYDKKPRIGKERKIVHRNDPCPCGRKKIYTYRAADGSIFKEEEVINKFKNCCLKKQFEPSGNILSTHELLKARRERVGWPMRRYLSIPVHQRGTR